MSVWDYLSRFVWVSRQRKQIYKRIFLKHLKYTPELQQPLVDQEQKPTEIEIQFPLPEYKDRIMNIKHLYQALEDVLEFYGTENNINKVLQLIKYKDWEEDKNQLNFRIWCGIVAFAERLALDDPEVTDSCDELEKADFNSMELRIHSYKVSDDLRQVFDIIIRTHNLKY